MDLVQKVKVFKESHSGSKTSLLWFQYMHTIEILHRFLKAEPSSNWMLHLQTVCKMMSFCTASGHQQYEKSSYMYLQTMLELPKSHPGVQWMCQNIEFAEVINFALDCPVILSLNKLWCKERKPLVGYPGTWNQ